MKCHMQWSHKIKTKNKSGRGYVPSECHTAKKPICVDVMETENNPDLFACRKCSDLQPMNRHGWSLWQLMIF